MNENPHSMVVRHAMLNTVRTIMDHLRYTDEDYFAEDIAGLEALRDHLLDLEGWHWLDDMQQTIEQVDTLPHSLKAWVLDYFIDDIS